MAIDKVVETLKSFQKQARETSDRLMQEAEELCQYADRLQTVIDAADKLPELGPSLLAKIGPPPGSSPGRKGLSGVKVSDEELTRCVIHTMQVERRGLSQSELMDKAHTSWDRSKAILENLEKQRRVQRMNGLWFLVKTSDGS